MSEPITEFSSPGKSSGVMSSSDAVAKNPDFFTQPPPGETQKPRWQLTVRHLDGRVEDLPLGTEWQARSPFGTIRSVVVGNEKGEPFYDTPRYEVAPSVVIVAWGKDSKTGEIKIGMISEKRPLLDNPEKSQGHDPMLFQQIPMGFLNKVIGKGETERLESIREGAARELSEETGTYVVKDFSEPSFPYNYPDVSRGSPTGVAFLEVDLDAIGEQKTDHAEQIYQANYLPIKDVLKDIERGKTEMGYSRLAVSNTAILMFLSSLSSFQNAERNDKLLSQVGQANKAFKQNDPEGYVKQMVRQSGVKHPEKFDENKAKAETYLSNLYKQNTPNQKSDS